MDAIDELVRAFGALDLLADIALILLGLETLRQRDRITRVETTMESLLRSFQSKKGE